MASSELSAVMFADDTIFFLSDKNIEVLFNKMNTELDKVSTWFKANKLSLNVLKTKFSIFHPADKKRLIPTNLPLLKIDNTYIKSDSVTKFLVVLIDENLNWKARVANVSSKVSKSIGIFYKATPILNKFQLKQLYFAFVHNYLNYGNKIRNPLSPSETYCSYDKLPKSFHSFKTFICRNENIKPLRD